MGFIQIISQKKFMLMSIFFFLYIVGGGGPAIYKMKKVLSPGRKISWSLSLFFGSLMIL